MLHLPITVLWKKGGKEMNEIKDFEHGLRPCIDYAVGEGGQREREGESRTVGLDFNYYTAHTLMMSAV